MSLMKARGKFYEMLGKTAIFYRFGHLGTLDLYDQVCRRSYLHNLVCRRSHLHWHGVPMCPLFIEFGQIQSTFVKGLNVNEQAKRV